MSMPRKSVIGEVYNRMTIIDEVPVQGNRRVIAQCTCGAIKEVILGSLKNGRTKSCGCYKSEVMTTHGHSTANSRLYRIWAGMLQRCHNKDRDKYPEYGARGITVCPEWKGSFELFQEWAINNGYSDELTIDRRHNDEGYSPSNCRWVDKTIQSRNQRARAGSSQYTGVHLCNTTGKWCAMITVDKKKKNLGLFINEIDAAKARDQFIIDHGLKDFRMNNVL